MLSVTLSKRHVVVVTDLYATTNVLTSVQRHARMTPFCSLTSGTLFHNDTTQQLADVVCLTAFDPMDALSDEPLYR